METKRTHSYHPMQSFSNFFKRIAVYNRLGFLKKMLLVITLQWQTATCDQRGLQGPQDVAVQPEQLTDDVLPILPPNFDISFSVL